MTRTGKHVLNLFTYRKPLLVAVFLNILFGIGILLLSFYLWKRFFGLSSGEACFDIDGLRELCHTLESTYSEKIFEILVSATLPTVAGVAGIVYLTIAYRKRLQEERTEEADEISRLEDKFVKSVELLSRNTAMDHIAGLNSLASIADKKPELFNQRVVDTICSFLRASRLRVDPYKPNSKKEIEISQTAAIGIIRKHTAGNIENKSNSWSFCNFYLQQSEFFCPLHLKECHFNSRFEVWGSTFHRAVYANGTYFKKTKY